MSCLVINLLYHGDVAACQRARDRLEAEPCSGRTTEGSHPYHVLSDEKEEEEMEKEGSKANEEVEEGEPATVAEEKATAAANDAKNETVAAPTTPPPPSSGEVAAEKNEGQEETAGSLHSSQAEKGNNERASEEGKPEARIPEHTKEEKPAELVAPDQQAVPKDQQVLEAVPPSSHLLKAPNLESLVEALKLVKPVLPEESQVTLGLQSQQQPPPPKVKMTKKLSKHSLAGTKYAPGDYSNIPMYPQRTDGSSDIEGGSGDGAPLSYQSFIISNAVDARLSHSLELPAELTLQCMARTVYKSVLMAVLNSRPLQVGAPPYLGEGEKEESQRHDIPQELSSAAMLCHSIEQLLERAALVHSDIDIVSLLELWNELNSVIEEPVADTDEPAGNGGCATAPLLGEEPGTETEAVQEKRNRFRGDRDDSSPTSLAGLPICTKKVMNLLLDILLSSSSPTSPSSSSPKTWQLGVVLLHTAVKHHRGREVPVNWEKLLAVFVALFTTASTAGIQDELVSSLLFELVPARVERNQLDGMDREVRRGIHLLLEVLITVLEKG